ncbi:21743_t:CDS:2 [Entrophospora sp. SA101]|nr:21743_t:CDS:2 [Entrophospora sp. SA101]
MTQLIEYGLFFGLFFGLDYPEIKRAEYIPTICTVQSETIESRYCCYKDCDTTCGDSAPSSAPDCSTLGGKMEFFLPSTMCDSNYDK